MVAFVSGMWLEFNKCIEQINGHLSSYLEPSRPARDLAVLHLGLFLWKKDHGCVNLSCVCVLWTSLPPNCHSSPECHCPSGPPQPVTSNTVISRSHYLYFSEYSLELASIWNHRMPGTAFRQQCCAAQLPFQLSQLSSQAASACIFFLSFPLSLMIRAFKCF